MPSLINSESDVGDANSSQGCHFKRSRVDYQDLCGPFKLKDKQFAAQYYPFYCARLKTMRPLVEQSARKTWGSKTNIVTMSGLVDHAEQRVVIIGILFKNMVNQPTVLKEISYEENQLVPQPPQECYINDEDYLMLQDEKECVKLFGNISVASHVTGVTIGLYGYAGAEGNEFIVEDFCYPTLPNPWSEELLTADDKYILIVSGLGFSRNLPSKLTSALELLADYLLGLVEADKSAKIVRLVIAGNIIGEKVREEENKNDLTLRKPWLKKGKPYSVDIMVKADNFLSQLGQTIDIDIMPGPTDPTSQLLPQQALHPSILPKSSIISGIRSLTNPYAASFDSRLFIGISGQTVDNIQKFSYLKDPIEIMEKTVLWSHIAPTAPDTLHGYFNPEQDPFILTNLPNVYFVGNQAKFATKYKKIGPDQHHIRFISIPSFETSYSGALVNLKDLSCNLVSFC